MKIKWNEAGLRKMQQEIEAKVLRADKQIRALASGKSVDEVVPIAERGLSSIGVTLPAASLRDYSKHVAEGKDFKFILQ